MDNRYEIAEQNGMSREFADWFFDNKKAGCGNVWFMMMAAMWEGWQGRAAMLQVAEPVKTAYTLPFDQWLSQQTGTIDVECGCVMTEVFFHWLRVAYEAGNSPVIPDGWKLVPIELTGDMTNAMSEAILDDLHNVDVWRSVLAAAPQQEA